MVTKLVDATGQEFDGLYARIMSWKQEGSSVFMTIRTAIRDEEEEKSEELKVEANPPPVLPELYLNMHNRFYLEPPKPPILNH